MLSSQDFVRGIRNSERDWWPASALIREISTRVSDLRPNSGVRGSFRLCDSMGLFDLCSSLSLVVSFIQVPLSLSRDLSSLLLFSASSTCQLFFPFSIGVRLRLAHPESCASRWPINSSQEGEPGWEIPSASSIVREDWREVTLGQRVLTSLSLGLPIRSGWQVLPWIVRMKY